MQDAGEQPAAGGRTGIGHGRGRTREGSSRALGKGCSRTYIEACQGWISQASLETACCSTKY